MLNWFLIAGIHNNSYGQTYYNPTHQPDTYNNIALHKVKITSGYTEITLLQKVPLNGNIVLFLYPDDFVLRDNVSGKEYALKSKYVDNVNTPVLPGESKYHIIYFEPLANPSSDLSIYQIETFNNSLRSNSRAFRIDKINIHNLSAPAGVQPLLDDSVTLVILPIIDKETLLSYSPVLLDYFYAYPIKAGKEMIYPTSHNDVVSNQICISGWGSMVTSSFRFYIYNKGRIVDSLMFDDQKCQEYTYCLYKILKALAEKMEMEYNGIQSGTGNVSVVLDDKWESLKRVGGSRGNGWEFIVKDDRLYSPTASFSKERIMYGQYTFAFLPGFNATSVIMPDGNIWSKFYMNTYGILERPGDIIANHRGIYKDEVWSPVGFTNYPIDLNTVPLLTDYMSSILLGALWKCDMKELKDDIAYDEIFDYFPGLEDLLLPYCKQARVPYSYLAAGYKFKTINQPAFAVNCFASALITSSSTRLSSYEIAFIRASVFGELSNYYESKHLSSYSELLMLCHFVHLRFTQTQLAKDHLAGFYDMMSPLATNVRNAEIAVRQYSTESSKMNWRGIGYSMGQMSSSGLTKFGYGVARNINSENSFQLEKSFNREMQGLGAVNARGLDLGYNGDYTQSIDAVKEITNYLFYDNDEITSYIFDYLKKYADDKPHLQSLLSKYDKTKFSTFRDIFDHLKYIEQTIVSYELSGQQIPSEELNRF